MEQHLSIYLKTATKHLHIKAERHIFVQKLLRGDLSATEYVKYLQGLLPIYLGMERYLHTHKASVLVAKLYKPFLFRAVNIQKDINALVKDSVVAFNDDEVLKIDSLEQLLGYYYTRYFGDLSGGQILANVLQQKYSLSSQELAFYTFDLGKLKPISTINNLKICFDSMPLDAQQKHLVVAAAKEMFIKTTKVMDATHPSL